MKTNLFKAFAIAIAMTPLYNCSEETTEQLELQLVAEQIIVQQTFDNPPTCGGENPRARLTNNGTISFDFKIYDMNNILLESEDNLIPGATTDWKTFPDGESTFVITNHEFYGEKVSFVMDFCTELNLEISTSNQFTNVEPQEASN